MEVIIESNGTKVTKEGNCFLVEKITGEKVKLSSVQSECLIIYPSISLSTSAILLAMEKKCDIVFVDKYGHPRGRIWNSEFNSTPDIRRRQYEIFSTEKGVEIAKKYVCKKLEGLIEILEYFKIKDESNEKIKEAILKIEILKGKPYEVREQIMGYEGSSGKIFYSKISELFPKRYQFKKRELQEAKSEFNILLNYCYGILYRLCEAELIKKGLDPFLGILHSDSYNKKSFLFDFIEMFRPWAILRVTEFIKKKYIRIEHFDETGLTTEGKKEIVKYFNKYMEDTELYNGKNLKRKDVIGKEVEHLIRSLKGEL